MGLDRRVPSPPHSPDTGLGRWEPGQPMPKARGRGPGQGCLTWPSPVPEGLLVQTDKDSLGPLVRGNPSFHLPPALIFFFSEIK